MGGLPWYNSTAGCYLLPEQQLFCIFASRMKGLSVLANVTSIFPDISRLHKDHTTTCCQGACSIASHAAADDGLSSHKILLSIAAVGNSAKIRVAASLEAACNICAAQDALAYDSLKADCSSCTQDPAAAHCAWCKDGVLMRACRAHATSVLHVMHLLMMAPDGLRSRNMLHDTHILAGGQHKGALTHGNLAAE